MAVRREQLHGAHSARRPVSLLLRLLRLIFTVGGALFPGLAANGALLLWSRTRPVPESAAGRRVTRDASREIMVHDNLPVAIYRWCSSGPVVLFVHGWSGRASNAAAFITPLLDAGYQVIAPDLPGHGDTPGRSTNVLECAAVLQTLGNRYGPVHATITHSYGGMVVARAMQDGMRVNRVVMIAAPADVEFLLDGFARHLRLRERVVREMRRRMNRRFGGDYVELASTVSNARDRSAPALVIHDEDDGRVPWQQGERIAAAWPGAEFMRTRGLGHGRILRDPLVVQAAVEFIQARTRQAGGPG